MKRILRAIAMISLSMAVLIGCSSAPQLSEQQALQQFPTVMQLKEQLQSAENNGLNVLAPSAYNDASNTYKQANQLAQAADPRSESVARQGLATLSQAEQTAAVSRDLLEEVLDARTAAIQAGADTFNSSAFAKADKNLLDLTRMIESGRTERAKAKRADLIAEYRDLELAALKGLTVERAEAAIKEAKKRNAHKLAPKTYKLAEEEYALAQNVLEVDRTNTAKAEQHAQNALWQAQRSMQIVDMINNFKTSDFENEDIVLWYQDQVARIVDPVEQNVPFNQPNKEVVNGLNHRLQQLVAQQQSLESSIASAESQQRESEIVKSKFEFVSSLFTPQEAEVYQQGNNVLIRAYGIAFASGSTELTSKNFPLMNKILEAIKQFPDASIVVSGHTDNVGADKTNLELSQQRAANVAKFLTEIGQLPVRRVSTVGYGKERPVANNDTPEGRAANRRVEILIVNE